MTLSPEASAAGFMLMGLGLISSIAANIFIVIKANRRVPPIDQTLSNDYVTQREYQHCKESCDKTIARLDSILRQDVASIFETQRAFQKEVTDKIDLLSRELSAWQRGIAQQIGNLEGRVNRLEVGNHHA